MQIFERTIIGARTVIGARVSMFVREVINLGFVVIDLLKATCLRATVRTALAHPVDGLKADPLQVIKIGINEIAITGGRYLGLGLGWSDKDAAGVQLDTAASIFDWSENVLLHSQDPLNALWIKSGAFSAVQNLTGADGVANSGWTFDGIESSTSTIYQLKSSGLAPSNRHEPSLVLRQISPTGILRINSPYTGVDGDWHIDVSLLDTEWAIVDRNHPAVTIINEFISNASGQSGISISTTGAVISVGFFNAQLEEGEVTTSQKYTGAGTVSTDADIITRPTPSLIKQDGSWALKFLETPAGTAQALKALFSFDSDATNYTEIQLNAANITIKSILAGVSNGSAVGPYTHAAGVQSETRMYYDAATKTIGIKSDDVSGDISAVAWVTDVCTSHPVITALLAIGNRNGGSVYQGEIDNSGVPKVWPSRERAEAEGWL